MAAQLMEAMRAALIGFTVAAVAVNLWVVALMARHGRES